MEKKDKTLNVPNLRFPEFSGEWEKCAFGDITTNFSLRNKEQIQYPMYSVTNNRGFVPQSEQFEDREMMGEDIKAYKIIHEGDFAYNPARINVGSIAKYSKKDPCMISSLYVCFKTHSNIDKEWMMQLLKTPKMNFYYNVNGEGGVRVYLFYPNFARIRTSYPSLVEQQKIAAFLRLIDQRIETQKKVIEKYESLIKGIRCNLLKFDSSVRICKLKDICKITTGKLDANAMEEDGIYPFFTCAEEPFTINTYAFDTEALLVSGNGANVGYVNYCNGKFNAYQRTYVLYDFSVDIHYVRYYMDAFLKQRIDQEKNIGNTPYIVLSTLADMKICIPSPTRQQDICRIIKAIETKLTLEKGLYNSHQQVKDFLLRTMFI